MGGVANHVLGDETVHILDEVGHVMDGTAVHVMSGEAGHMLGDEAGHVMVGEAGHAMSGEADTAIVLAERLCKLMATSEKMAAIRIQSKYRQYRARKYLENMRRQKAAIRIQSMYRGYVTRKEGWGEKIKERLRIDAEKARALGRDHCVDLMGADFPAKPAGPDMGDCFGEKFDKDKDVADCLARYLDPTGDWM